MLDKHKQPIELKIKVFNNYILPIMTYVIEITRLTIYLTNCEQLKEQSYELRINLRNYNTNHDFPQ